MRNKTKALLVALCAVMLVAVGILGTLAYLTSSDTAVNTFTVGKVAIKLDEAKVDPVTGAAVTPSERVKENSYHLMPGHSYVKDPTVTVLDGSEDCYVRMLVKVNDISKLTSAMPKAAFPTFYNGDLFLLQTLCGGWDKDVWLYEGYNNGEYEFRYHKAVNGKGGDNELPALFSTITVPGEITSDLMPNLAGVEITVVAQAIQADGFATANAAWAQWK
ncbi:MAG: hypothetical protein E7328_06975 [Clostridiales bacterium]|nr:hypothetical protein [Clostridiales bacterium]